MVTEELVAKQLQRIGFNDRGWGRSEIKELPHILMSEEHIYEVANGIYEGGFALLVATDVRVLLVDKKPLNYLTVEDLRFDMISEIDYSHRLFGARISISTGTKNLKFTSYNQPRLRKLIGHVQSCMAEQKRKQSEHQEGQKTHLEQINQQLQAYLLAQHKQQLEWQEQLKHHRVNDAPLQPPEPVKPSPELADYLFAQSLLSQYSNQQVNAPVPVPGREAAPASPVVAGQPPGTAARVWQQQGSPSSANLEELYAEGYKEVFGKRAQPANTPAANPASPHTVQNWLNPLEINPLRIAYSKLPMALRNRKFGRPSFHAHSQQETVSQPSPAQL